MFMYNIYAIIILIIFDSRRFSINSLHQFQIAAAPSQDPLHLVRSVDNMLATTFSVGNSNVVVMCVCVPLQKLAIYVRGHLACDKSIGRWVEAK